MRRADLRALAGRQWEVGRRRPRPDRKQRTGICRRACVIRLLAKIDDGCGRVCTQSPCSCGSDGRVFRMKSSPRLSKLFVLAKSSRSRWRKVAHSSRGLRRESLRGVSPPSWSSSGGGVRSSIVPHRRSASRGHSQPGLRTCERFERSAREVTLRPSVSSPCERSREQVSTLVCVAPRISLRGPFGLRTAGMALAYSRRWGSVSLSALERRALRQVRRGGSQRSPRSCRGVPDEG